MVGVSKMLFFLKVSFEQCPKKLSPLSLGVPLDPESLWLSKRLFFTKAISTVKPKNRGTSGQPIRNLIGFLPEKPLSNRMEETQGGSQYLEESLLQQRNEGWECLPCQGKSSVLQVVSFRGSKCLLRMV